MLKDKLSKFFNNSKKEKDPLNINIMDGFVNIKGYKVDKDGNKKLVYHDCGDNVVTDWMRHAIITLLTGDAFLPTGKSNEFVSSEESLNSADQLTFFNSKHHRSDNKKNFDGYLVNGNQYFWSETDNDVHVDKYSKTNIVPSDKNIYSVFPTKVLFGTGKEYANWEVLQSENEVANATWYQRMLNYYSGGTGAVNTAKNNFDKNIKDVKCNVFSGTIIDDLRNGEGSIAQMRTVNNPSTSSEVINSDRSTNKSYGVVGAIKTPYFDEMADNEKLNPTFTDSGKVLKAEWNGIGRPCFIYFNTPKGAGEGKGSVAEGWDDATSDVHLSKDKSSKYLNKITFKIVMPAQSAVTNSVEAYYPYNGYTLRQIGLYNDTYLVNSIKAENNDATLIENMPCGTLLAIKDISSLEKTAEMELVMTWTLTI